MSSRLSIEKQYILDLKKGSYRAFDALYTMYARRLYAYALKITKSTSDANEIVQDTFVNLWTHRENIEPSDSLQAYLFTITKNVILNKFRKLINSPVFVNYVEYLNEENIASEEISEKLEFEEFQRKLEDAKTTLSATQVKVFELRKELGYNNAEVAKQLNLSEQTVKNQLSLALKKLRTKLAEHLSLFFICF
ncbi:MAG TPA: RNA polymerase sigma-70 factor [Paludibacter sp.]|nr:RNA polymerase sigma-70 factor [Paludibacter sp.]